MAAKTSSDTLKKLAFFSGLPETLVWHLARAAERRELAPDELLFTEGKPRDLLAIIVSGTLSIEKHTEGSPISLAMLGPGEVIGEGILFEEGEHSSRGRATEPTTVLFFRKEPLMKLLKDQPALYAALIGRAAKIMNARIKTANRNLVDTRTDWPAEHAIVNRWLDAITKLSATVGAEKAIQAAQDACKAGKDVRTLAGT